nr:hypothetical protein CFP56_02831 [Quercus suber]
MGSGLARVLVTAALLVPTIFETLHLRSSVRAQRIPLYSGISDRCKVAPSIMATGGAAESNRCAHGLTHSLRENRLDHSVVGQSDLTVLEPRDQATTEL